MDIYRAGGPERVLIVDDVKQYRDQIAEALRGSWDLAEASDGAEAKLRIEEARREGRPFTVLITDMHMANDPEDGKKLIQWTKHNAKELLGLAITHRLGPEQRLEIREAGAFDALNLDQLADAVLAKTVRLAVETAIRFRTAQDELALVRKFADPEIRELVRLGNREVQLQPADATILFWDLKGFTKLTEALRARGDLVANLLREYYDLATEVVASHHGILDKFIGDGVMAIFGFRRKEDAGATDALLASLEFHQRFMPIAKHHRLNWEDETGLTPSPEIGLRCGMDTGVRLLVGLTGTRARDHFTAFGPEVNRANRIEAAAERSLTGILASAPTRIRHLRERVRSPGPTIIFGDRMEVSLEGIVGRTVVYPVLGIDPDTTVLPDVLDDPEDLIQAS